MWFINLSQDINFAACFSILTFVIGLLKSNVPRICILNHFILYMLWIVLALPYFFYFTLTCINFGFYFHFIYFCFLSIMILFWLLDIYFIFVEKTSKSYRKDVNSILQWKKCLGYSWICRNSKRNCFLFSSFSENMLF